MGWWIAMLFSVGYVVVAALTGVALAGLLILPTLADRQGAGTPPDPSVTPEPSDPPPRAAPSDSWCPWLDRWWLPHLIAGLGTVALVIAALWLGGCSIAVAVSRSDPPPAAPTSVEARTTTDDPDAGGRR